MLVVRDVTAPERSAPRGRRRPRVPGRRARAALRSCRGLRRRRPAPAGRARATGPGPLDWPEHFRLYRRRRPHAADRGRGAAVPRAPGRGRDRRSSWSWAGPATEQRHVLVSIARPVVAADGRPLGAVAHGRRRHRPARDRGSPARQRGALPLGRRERPRHRLPDRPAGPLDVHERELVALDAATRSRMGSAARPTSSCIPTTAPRHARAFAPLIAGEVDSVLLRPSLPDRRGRDALGRGARALARDAAGRPLGRRRRDRGRHRAPPDASSTRPPSRP